MIISRRKKYCNFRESFTKYIEDSRMSVIWVCTVIFAKPDKT